MAKLLWLLDLLRTNANALNVLTLQNLFHFVIYAACLKNDILLPQPAVHSPLVAPELLPCSVLCFLSSAVDFPSKWQRIAGLSWRTLFGIQTTLLQGWRIWRPVHGYFLLMVTHLDFVRFHYDVAAPANVPGCTVPCSIYPHQWHCLYTNCQRTEGGLILKKAEQWQVVLYTLNDGPVWSIHLYCESMPFSSFVVWLADYWLWQNRMQH